MTPEEYTTVLIDYCEHPRTVYNVTTIYGIFQEENSLNLVKGTYNPAGTGHGPVHIRRYNTYQEYHYYQYCSKCRKEIEVESPDDEMIDYPSGTVIGEEWEEEHYIKHE